MHSARHVLQAIAAKMRGIRSSLADDSGEILTAILLGLSLGSLALGGAQTGAATINQIDLGAAANHMAYAADAQQAKFESSKTLQSKLSAEEKAALYKRWEGMRSFAGKTKSDALWDSFTTSGEFLVDLGLTVAAPAYKGNVLLETTADAFSVKDPFDIYKAHAENGSSAAPELFEYTREMKAQVEGRASAEDFTVPLRKTAAANKVADMRADVDQVNAVSGGAKTAAFGVVRERMADAIALSYTELKKSGAIPTREGGYDEFIRRQVLATHPRELANATPGDILADETAREFFDAGKCDSLLATIQTGQGPVMVVLKRESGGKITATSLATAETVTADLTDGDAEPAGAEQPSGPWEPGTYKGSAQYHEQAIPFEMVAGSDGAVVAKPFYDGPTPTWEEHPDATWEVVALRLKGQLEGTVSAAGEVTGSGTVNRLFTHSDGRGGEPYDAEWTIVGTIQGGTFEGYFVEQGGLYKFKASAQLVR